MSIPNILSVNFLVPGVAHKFDSSNAIRGLRGMPRSLTLIGQHDASAGSLVVDELTQITTEPNAIALLGEGSQLLEMWRGANDNAGLGLPIKVIALAEDGGASAATSTVTIAVNGTNASHAGQAVLWIGGKRVIAGVKVGDTATDIATTIKNKINADAHLVVSAANLAGVVTLTANWKGLTGNDIDVRVGYYADEILPKNITATVVAMSGGAVNPAITPVITALDGQRETEIVAAFTDSATLAALEAELESRWNPDDMKDGQLCYTLRGTEGEIVTALSSRNSHQAHTITVTKDLTNPWVTAAMAAAAIESNAAIDPAVPFTGIQLKGYLPAKQKDDFIRDQHNVMLVAGGSPLLNTNGEAELYRMVTNYTENSLGAADASYRNLNWVKTLSYYRWFVVTEFQIKYRGYKLAEYLDEAVAGQKVMTKDLGEEIMAGIYEQFLDVVMMQNPDHYRDTLLVEVDGPNGKLKVIDEPVIVTQHYQTEITSRYAAGHV